MSLKLLYKANIWVELIPPSLFLILSILKQFKMGQVC